jgi:hypothetical protein
VEVDAPDGPVVLVEAVEEGAHAVVPHLDDAAVEAGQDPWAARVEGKALDPVALGLELGEHLPPSSEEGDLRSLSAAAALAGGGTVDRRKGTEWRWISPALSQMRIEIPAKLQVGAVCAAAPDQLA